MQPVYYKLPKHNIIFLGMPKCANSSVKSSLLPLLDLPKEVDSKKVHKIFAEFQITKAEAEELFPSCFSFTVVRNPWDRLISTYSDKINRKDGWHERLSSYDMQKNMSFSDFVDKLKVHHKEISDVHIRSQMSILKSRSGMLSKFICRFESLPEDFKVVQAFVESEYGISLPALPVINKSKHKHYSHYYNGHTRREVRDIYLDDINAFGYKFEKLDND
ncbi:sulfotransferase family 2 domain-containing protein [Psychromonas algicola]|uniref:sulfotransferase family 2 domain-containing protein n=1 Tax=Psychromonas algicola TaxID=2555642 RepID=UPI00106742F1|nr:sulfotransferase family 2 domain-containing protein [Psychromonas sp. RZ5]TEW52313.1 hypothetical protein E2R67_03080 [Psychromonas sp. RZ5]